MKKVFVHIILLGDFERVPPLSFDWFRHYVSAVAVFFPVSIMTDFLFGWFSKNKEFWVMVFVALVLNGLVGAYTHLKFKSFSPKLFVFRNFEMGAICGITYVMLDMVTVIAGDNLAGELFGKLIQISTILYPASKILKNMFILSRGKHPPEFVMRRLYNFEKNGDLTRFFETEKGEELDASAELNKLKEEAQKHVN